MLLSATSLHTTFVGHLASVFASGVTKPDGPLALHAHEQQQPEAGLLFLLQLIGPDCHPDHQELPQHLTQALKDLLNTARADSIGLLNFTSPNGQLPHPGRVLLESGSVAGALGVPEPRTSAARQQPALPVLADEQPHHHSHHHHSVLRKLLQGMNSHEPALMFLYAADPQHDTAAVHLQLGDLVASGQLGDAVRGKGILLNDVHLVAFEPMHGDHPPFGISGKLTDICCKLG